jgi:NAD+-dependent protein deacetylase sirtuin 4
MRIAIMSALQLTFITPLRPSRSFHRYPFSTKTTAAATGFHRLDRDRIGSDGHLQLSSPTEKPQSTSHPNYVIGSPIPNSVHPAPDVPPPTPAQLDSLADFITTAKGFDKEGGGGVLIITGAGCSTESNVPDYRGPAGAYSTGFKPMTHQNFMASETNRSRYWARSFAGWPHFSNVQPNAAHEGIAALQKANFVGHVITQNVDRLHQKAGSKKIIELHGTTHEVICMTCRNSTPRNEVQLWLARLNSSNDLVTSSSSTRSTDGESEEERMLRAGTTLPIGSSSERIEKKKINLREAGAGVIRPDGDVELPQYKINNDNSTNTSNTNASTNSTVLEPAFLVPPCPACGGILKPDVVFFGDSLPPKRTETALHMAQNASRVLVVGSSLAVWSAYRLVKAAKEQGRPEVQVAVVNVGPTRADEIVDLKLEVRAGDAMNGLKDLLVR